VPDNPASVVAAQAGEQPAVVRPIIGEPAENPSRNRNDIPWIGDVFPILTVAAPAETPVATERHEYFGGEMDVQVIGDPMGHCRGTDIEAMRLWQVDQLLGAAGHSRPDDRIVLFQMRSGFFAVNEGHCAGNVVLALHMPAGSLFLGEFHLRHCCDLHLPVQRSKRSVQTSD